MNALYRARFGALAAALALAMPAGAQQITFMTGPQGGSWIPLGGALKSLWEAQIPGLLCGTRVAVFADEHGFP